MPFEQRRGPRGQTALFFDANHLRSDIKLAWQKDIGAAPKPCREVEAGRFQNAPSSLKEEAKKRLSAVDSVRAQLIAHTNFTVACRAVGKELGVDEKTIKRHYDLVEGIPRESWLDALVPAYKGRQAQDIAPALWQAFRDDFGRVERPQLRAVWDRVKALADRLALPCPSEKTFQRRFRQLPAGVQIVMRYGEQALVDAFPHQARDRSHMLSLDSCNSDAREWDVRVMWPDGTIRRPVVTLAEDDATHFIVAYEVDVVESAAGYRRVFRRICTVHGVPKKMRYDNTRAAANKGLTAGAKGRKRFKDQADDLDGLLKELKVEVSFAEVRNGKTKGAERVFAEIKERSEKDPRLAGAYTGRSPSEKPTNYGEATAPLELFEEVLREEVHRYNNAVRTRSSVVTPGTSYAQAFSAGLAEAKPRRLTRVEEMFYFRTKKVVTVNGSGEVFLGTAPNQHRYYHEELMNYAHRCPGQKVVIRYEENDLSVPVYVEDLAGVRIVEQAERLVAGAFNSAAQAGEHGRAKKGMLKAAKLKIREEQAMDAVMAAGAASHEPKPEGPTPVASPKVVSADFGSKAHQVKREAEAATVERDPAKVAAVRRAIRGENSTATEGPDLERRKRGLEFLARRRAG